MYAGNLEDLRSLVSSRVKDTHVHISVDAQTGLGTGILGTGSPNVGTATVTHRRCHESDEQHSGDAGRYRSTVLAEHVRGTGCPPCYQ